MAVRGAKLIIDRLPTCTDGEGLMPVVEKLRSAPHAVTLDASRVKAIDPTGLEALLVIAATQRERGNGFALENASDAFLSDLTLFGVSPEQLKGP